MDATLQLLIQGGAVGISLALIWIVYKQNQNQMHANEMLTNTLTKIAEEHRLTIERNTDAWIKNTEALGKLNRTMT